MKPTSERLQALIDAYGADPRRWPAAEREAAQSLAGDRRFEAQLAQARALDASLDRLPGVEPDAALRFAILSALPERTPSWREAAAQFLAGIGGWRMAGPALALALAGGVASGVLFETDASAVQEEDNSPDFLALAQLGEPSWSDEGESP